MTKDESTGRISEISLEKNFNYLAATDPETAPSLERGGRYSILDLIQG